MNRLANVINFLMRLIIPLPLMLWGLAMLGLGLSYGSPPWLITALVTIAFGAVAMVGSPLIGWLLER